MLNNMQTPIKTDQDILMEMADEYSKASNELAIIKVEKSTALLMLMATEKSCKAAEIKWGASVSGQREIILTYLLKCLEKRMSALRHRINSFRAY